MRWVVLRRAERIPDHKRYRHRSTLSVRPTVSEIPGSGLVLDPAQALTSRSKRIFKPILSRPLAEVEQTR